MNGWDKLLYGMIFIAIVAVIFGSSKSAGLISTVGSFATQLTQNIVGVPQSNG